MKRFSIICAALPVLIFSCTKQGNTGLHPAGENQKLFEIIGDSASVPIAFNQFEYSGDKISRATLSNSNTGVTDVTTFEYDGSNHYIRATDEDPNVYNEWFINDLKLPVKTVQRLKYSRNYIEVYGTSELDFSYDPHTNHLDSITTMDTNGNVVLLDLFEYTDENITSVIQFKRDPNRIDTFYFSYDSNANAFRNADPLWYVYSSPAKYYVPFYNPITLVQIFSKDMAITYSFKWYERLTYTIQYSVVNDNQLKDFYLFNENMEPTDINAHYIYQ